MCLYAHYNFQVNKDYTKRSSRDVFNLLDAMPFFEAMVTNANIKHAASFHCVFATKHTFFYKGTDEMVNFIKANFIFDSVF